MRNKRKKAGLPPGSIVFTGNKKVEKIQIHYLQYNDEKLTEETLDNQKDIVFHRSRDEIIDWYDIRGIHDSELIGQIGKAFEIHPLILEDISDINQRPKFEEYTRGIFLIIRGLHFNKATKSVETEQVALYFRKGLVISFQESNTDLFEAVRNRIKTSSGRIRQRGSDYLAYALSDVLVDHYFFILDEIEAKIEAIETKMLDQLDMNLKADIHNLKKELLIVRKSIAPLREAISQFGKTESTLIENSTVLFIRDLYDHTIQVMDITETFRDLLNGLQDLFVTELSFKMNQVMQVLTLVATIFIPLTFLAGIYGMNFDFMPELHWKYSYFVLWAIMIIIFSGLFMYFRKKKWF